jgi:cell division cycle 14
MQIRSNAAVLIGMFSVLYLNKTPEQAYYPLATLQPALVTFRDASYGTCSYKLTVLDVISGLYQAMLNGFLNFETFNLEEYEHYERIEHGDFNWMVPDKFISLAGPHNERHVQNGYPHLCPEDYFEYFKANNVTDIIRLNKKMYDRSKFVDAGFVHHELFFTDGSCPPAGIFDQFMQVCEVAKGAIVVHCKAGLGRTGTLMGCYIMKHHRMTASETIAWMRVARPGSIIGPQQHYMARKQPEMWMAGADVDRRREEHRPRWATTDLTLFGIAPCAMPPTPTRVSLGKSLPSVARALDAQVAASELEDDLALTTPADCHEHSGWTQGDELTARKAQAQREHAAMQTNARTTSDHVASITLSS